MNKETKKQPQTNANGQTIINSATSNKKEFGNYIIGKTLGEGTFGKVLIGTHKLTNENVAIKILQKSKINDLADTERVLRQIHILKLVRHPNIVQLYQIIQTPKRLYLVMEYMQRGQLFQYIVSKKRLKQQQACRLFHQLIDGIQHIHKIKVVHRDLKPQNLLLDYKMNLRIVDFGLSNTYKQNQRLKTACGSPCYAAPQMLKGQAYQGLGVDIWSAGVILFAMVCGYLPFQDNQNQAELYKKIMDGQYNISVSVSDAVKDLIRKILTVDPHHRYTIDQIRKHPWMTQNCPQRKSTKGIIIGYNKIPIDPNVLQSLAQMQIDAQKTQNCLQANRHNNLTTTYYLALKKFIKQGGHSLCDLSSKDFDKKLLQPVGNNNRRDMAKNNNVVLIQNFFTGSGTESTNTNMRKKSKQKIKQKIDRQKIQKSKEKIKQKQNKQPNHQQKSRQNIIGQKSCMLPSKKSRKDSNCFNTSKIAKIDPRIQCSINYGRPSTTKSNEKNNTTSNARRQSQFENRLNRKYKQKFNQSLVSKSKDKIHSIPVNQQQSFHQPYNSSHGMQGNSGQIHAHHRSRIDSSVTRIQNRVSNQTCQIADIMQDITQNHVITSANHLKEISNVHNGRKRTNSKKSCGQSIKSDMLKIAKARWM